MIELTRELIFEYRTKRGSWTRAQIEAIGISWPPKRGWLDDVVGKIISEREFQCFIDGRNEFVKRKKKYNKPLNFSNYYTFIG